MARLVGNLARIPDRTSGQVSDSDLWLFPLFQSFAQVDAGGSTIVLGHGSETEVRVLDDEFNLRLIVRWTEPDREVTADDVRAWREAYIARRRRIGEREWRDFDDSWISPERPVAELFPAISSIMIGRDGRIWVRPIRSAPRGSGDGSPSSPTVVSSATFPPGSRVPSGNSEPTMCCCYASQS